MALFFFSISNSNFYKSTKTIKVNMSILPTKVLSIEEIYDYDPFSPSTGFTKEDSPPIGEVNFGYIYPGTHIIGSIENYYAIKVSIISNQLWNLYIYSETNLIGNNNTLPISRLMYAIDDGTIFNPFSLTPKKVKSGGKTNLTYTTFDYLLYLKTTDPPDEYRANIKIEVH